MKDTYLKSSGRGVETGSLEPCGRIAGTLHIETACCHLHTLVPLSRIFLPSRWRRYILPKRRFTQDIHGATSQKTAFFIVTAVKTSNPTNWVLSQFSMSGRNSGAVTLMNILQDFQKAERVLVIALEFQKVHINLQWKFSRVLWVYTSRS
jgi:hypothetical protein